MTERQAENKNRAGILAVVGPTAGGKSALALRLAETFRGTVINSDSLQLYRELRILTARPTPADEALAPHRLYGVLGAASAGSAALWREMALSEIEAALGQGRVPILVGGTGLYLRALLEGLAPVPEVPPEVRESLRRRHAAQGGPAFHAELAESDPVMAARIPPGDTQRLIRAAEVLAATGRSLAFWQQERPMGALAHPVLILRLLPPREALYAACDARFRRMLAEGALAEAKAFRELGLPPGLPASKALGLPELCRHLAGEIPLEEAIAAAQQATRRYAKRQVTWLRHQTRGRDQIDALITLDQQFSESTLSEILPFIRRFLLTPAE